MELHEYVRLDGVGLAELIRTRQVTPPEVESVAREALKIADERLNGLTRPSFPNALDAAGDGPFAGVPFLLKDVPIAAGVPFTLGSRAIPDIAAAHDTELMTRFRRAGLVALGITTMCELGLSFATESARYGPTRNPYDPARGVGGSSGGAAALVAAGAVPLAHANDGAGSIRVPASCCGLVGLKPGRGRIPCGPDTGEAAFGLLYEFAVTRSVRDAAHLLDAVHGPAAGDKYLVAPPLRPYAEELDAPHPRLRIALTTDAWSGVPVDPEVAAATARTGRLLERLGHTVEVATPALDWEDVLAGIRGEVVAGVAPLLSAPRQPPPEALEAVSRAAMSEVRAFTALDLLRTFDAHNRVSRAVGTFFADYDLLVTPTLGQLPAPHGTLDYDNPRYSVDSWLRRLFAYGPFTAVFNISGQPAVSLPLGRSASGLPIGVQVVAGSGREDQLIRIAAALEPDFATAADRQGTLDQ
ncbi:amidase [Actinoplanes sp. NPDC049681]|uniref:amidase n=1 Tax=Actinoplanes sp. NPDC049681 TaxID=3363905 RepID=UPI003793E459